MQCLGGWQRPPAWSAVFCEEFDHSDVALQRSRIEHLPPQGRAPKFGQALAFERTVSAGWSFYFAIIAWLSLGD